MEHIDLKIQAKVGTICMKIISDCREITAFYIDGITAGYIMKASYSQANVNLFSITIIDLNTESAYKNVSCNLLRCFRNIYVYYNNFLIMVYYVDRVSGRRYRIFKNSSYNIQYRTIKS